MGKRTAQKDTIIDITGDSQVNSNFPYRWSPASLTLNNYFYLFLYLYITRITINNNTPHLKSQKSRLGTASNKITGGGGARTSLRSTNPRPCFCFGSPDKTTTNSKTKQIKHKRKAKRAAGIEGQVATMLETHTRQIDTQTQQQLTSQKKV